MKPILSALACIAFVAATPAAATNVLQNPGFETGSLAPWVQARDFSNNVPWFVTDADSHTGTYSAQDTGNTELRQDFAGVDASSIDQVSFWARHPDQGVSAIAYDFFYSDLTSTEFIADTSGTDWNFFDVTNQLDPTRTLVGFSMFGNSQGITRLDDVVIDVAGGVPEPATWALMLLGFAATGLALRGRSKQVPSPYSA